MSTHSLAQIIHPASPEWSNRLKVPATSLSSFWKDWLLDQGSLTLRLTNLNKGEFRVVVLHEGFSHSTPLEKKELGLNRRESIWKREVVLLLGKTPVIYARTAIPNHSLCGSANRLRYLGNRSLGSFLFSQPSLQRSPLQISHCIPNHLSVEWCRRSLFHVFNRPLMVSEAFTDDFFQLVHNQ